MAEKGAAVMAVAEAEASLDPASILDTGGLLGAVAGAAAGGSLTGVGWWWWWWRSAAEVAGAETRGGGCEVPPVRAASLRSRLKVKVDS